MAALRPRDLDVEGLLKVALVLVIVYIAVDHVFGALSSVVGLLIVVLIVLWFLDYT